MNRFQLKPQVNPAFKIAQALPTLTFVHRPKVEIRSPVVDFPYVAGLRDEKRLNLPVSVTGPAFGTELVRASEARSSP